MEGELHPQLPVHDVVGCRPILFILLLVVVIWTFLSTTMNGVGSIDHTGELRRVRMIRVDRAPKNDDKPPTDGITGQSHTSITTSCATPSTPVVKGEMQPSIQKPWESYNT